ncbi:unnamed protein product [Acanthoscelides obtectus]|uniref:Uncharacterized protein n=1 Tax=Acanthoscelides obtectus TaxID=200917 RepID=A0A9P0KNJ2_ACAOB|nr:unnamed protein product [Acanthoscelides obtectus]CAK1628216.1 hypothetical protein AOBTE_LOCUS5077 [Acanthoscelides obtectus]
MYHNCKAISETVKRRNMRILFNYHQKQGKLLITETVLFDISSWKDLVQHSVYK